MSRPKDSCETRRCSYGDLQRYSQQALCRRRKAEEAEEAEAEAEEEEEAAAAAPAAPVRRRGRPSRATELQAADGTLSRAAEV